MRAILENSADQAVFALMDAMVSPVLGVARRPRVVLVENEATASALRNAKELVGHDIAALIDVRVERDAHIAELARAFVHIHAEAKGEEAEDAIAIGPERHLSNSAAPVHTAAMAPKPPHSGDPYAHEDEDGYRLPDGRRHDVLSFLKLHSQGKEGAGLP